MDIDKPNLENDLLNSEYIKNKCKISDIYSQNLYASLCNNLLYKNNQEWSCSWRYAGGIIADIRAVGEDYIDFYCSGIGGFRESLSIPSLTDGYVGESFVTDEIRSDLLKLGWVVKSYPNDETSV